MHVRFGCQRINHEPSVMTINGANKPPISSPRVHLDLCETRAHTFRQGSSLGARNASALLADRTIRGLNQFDKTYPLCRTVHRGNDAVFDSKLGGINLQNIRCTFEEIP